MNGMLNNISQGLSCTTIGQVDLYMKSIVRKFISKCVVLVVIVTNVQMCVAMRSNSDEELERQIRIRYIESQRRRMDYDRDVEARDRCCLWCFLCFVIPFLWLCEGFTKRRF